MSALTPALFPLRGRDLTARQRERGSMISSRFVDDEEAWYITKEARRHR